VGVIWVDVRVPLGTSENCPAIRSNFIYCRISRVPPVFRIFIFENIMGDWGLETRQIRKKISTNLSSLAQLATMAIASMNLL